MEKEINYCPKCQKGIIREENAIKGFVNRRKVVTFYCPLCDFENKHTFDVTKGNI